MTTRDDSVMTALGDLRQLEDARIQAELEARRRAEEQHAADRREAEALAVKEREAALEHARRAAEAEARAAELARDRSIESLRRELAAVQTERDRARGELLTRSVIEPSPSHGRWVMAVAISSIATAALAGLLVLRQPVPAETAELPRDAARIASTPAGAMPETPPPLAPEVEPVAAPMVTEAIEARPLPHRRVTREREREGIEPRRDDLSQALGLERDEGDDVLGDSFLREATRHR